MQYDVPVLFLFFNRIETTKIVFSEIRKLKPSTLYLAQDGSRDYVLGEFEKCQEIRESILKSIDWKCDIKTLFRTSNLGCGLAVSSAINWFFEHVEEGIIIEDDCVPHPDFFYYCREMLDKFRYNTRIAVIGGNNFLINDDTINSSYFFSNYSFTWGWATWRRVWKNYQFDLNQIDKVEMFKCIDNTFKSNEETKFWKKTFEEFLELKIDTWDYQLWFHVWLNNMCSIVPNVNLVANIGFGEDATHTFDPNSSQASLKTESIMPFIHPKTIKIDHKLDYIYFRTYWSPKLNHSFKTKIKILFRRLRSIFK